MSAPFIQARQIEQAGIGPGDTVLEIGSGGLNAALIAEVVGESGRVFTVDIDPDVTTRASAALDATGYTSRVVVHLADAEHPIPDLGSVDAIVVTAGAWDLSPAWLAHLAPTGRLAVPLRMNGITRSIGFRRVGDHLESQTLEECGFVPMQGDGAHHDRTFVLPDPAGNAVDLRFDADPPGDLGKLDGVLSGPRTESWSGVTIPYGVSFADLILWFACRLPGFCRITAEPGTALAREKVGRDRFPFGIVDGGSIAYLASRPAGETRDSGAEYGARGWGDAAAVQTLAAELRAWDEAGRPSPDSITYWPHGSDHARIPDQAAVLEKEHGLVAISWSTAD